MTVSIDSHYNVADQQINVSEWPHQMGLNAENTVKSKLNNFATAFRFTMDTSRLTTTPIVTPSIELHGVMWTVQFKHKNNNIDIHLIPNFDNAASDSVEIEATYKLLQRIDRKDKTFAKFLSKRLIKRQNANALIMEKYVNWNDFKLNFEYEHKATFEIEIIANPVNRKDLKPPNGLDVFVKKAIIELEDLSATGQRIASEFELRGIKWTIYTERNAFGGYNGSVGVYLKANENDLEKLSWEVHAKFTLLSFNNKIESIQHTFTHDFNVASPMRKIEKFVDWNDLFDPNKKFVFNEKANLFVEIKVDKIEPIWNL